MQQPMLDHTILVSKLQRLQALVRAFPAKHAKLQSTKLM
jgi:hypothetical protein